MLLMLRSRVVSNWLIRRVSDLVLVNRFHFDALAHDNSATSQVVRSVVETTTQQGNTPPPVLLQGTQTVPKFNSAEPDEVQILLALYRVENKNVDFVMSMNVPTKSTDGGVVNSAAFIEAQRVFEAAASSLKIVDFGLFA